jgi:uncharacterized membrane protein
MRLHDMKNVSGTQKKLRWIILVSLAVNLFLIGVVAAPFFGRGLMMGLPPPPPPTFMVERLARDLPPKDAATLRAIFADVIDSLGQSHEAEKKAIRQLAVILRQDEPDIQAMQHTFEGIQTSGRTMHQGMAKALQRVATELPLDSRRKIAAFMERGPMLPPDGGHDGPPMGPNGVPNGPRPPMIPGDDRPSPMDGN